MSDMISKEDFIARMKQGSEEEVSTRTELFLKKIFIKKYKGKGYKTESFFDDENYQVVVIDEENKIIEEFYHENNEDFFNVCWDFYNETVEQVVDKEAEKKNENIEQIVLLEVNSIEPSNNQFRTEFDDVSDLAENFNLVGQTTPIQVEKTENGFKLISGERRLSAAKLLGWKNIKAIVIDGSDDKSLILGGIENFQRRNLKPSNAGKQILAIREEIKKNNRVFDVYPVIPIEEYEKLPQEWREDVWASNKHIDDIITRILGLKRSMQFNLVRLLKDGNESLIESIDNGKLAIEEGSISIKLDIQDLDEEIQASLIRSKNRKDYIDQVRARVADKTDESHVLLKETTKLGARKKVFDRIDINKVDPRTVKDTRSKMIDFILGLMEKFNITLEEIGEIK